MRNPKLLTYCRLLAFFCCLSSTSLAEENSYALVRPWVADHVMLSEEQKAQVRTKVVEFQSAVSKAVSDYPKGAQDREGTDIREEMEKLIHEKHVRIGEEIRSLLDKNQLERFGKLMPTFPKQTVMLEQREIPPEKAAADDTTIIFVNQELVFASDKKFKSFQPAAEVIAVDGLKSMAKIGNAKPVFWHDESERILAGAVSPNERFVVTLGGSAPGVNKTMELRLWDAKSGELLDIHVIKSGGSYGAGRAGAVKFSTSEHVVFGIDPFDR